MADLPIWGKILLYGGAIGAAAYLIYSVLTSPINAWKDMWTKQYKELVQKMANYTTSSSGSWTTAQQQNVDTEEKILDQTGKGLAEASRGLPDMIVEIAVIVTAIGVAGSIVKTVIDKYVGKTGGTVRTAAGAGYIAIVSFADHMATNGYVSEASSLISSAQTMFATLDAPYMQQSISSITASLPTLTGIQLIIAQQQIEALTVEMAAIPILLALPLPII